MARPKGSPNKITADVKDKLQLVIDDVVSHLDITAMTTDQKIKMLQIGLQYLIPRLKHVHDKKEIYEPPLFLTE